MLLPLRFTGVAGFKIGGSDARRNAEKSITRAECIKSACPAKSPPAGLSIVLVLELRSESIGFAIK